MDGKIITATAQNVPPKKLRIGTVLKIRCATLLQENASELF